LVSIHPDQSTVTPNYFLSSRKGLIPWIAKGASTRFAVEDRNASLEVLPPESVTYVDYDNPFAFIGECRRTTPIVHQLSPLAWVSVGRDIYILECFDAGFIRVEPLKDPEGDSLALPRASHRLTPKPRAGGQVPSALYPGQAVQSHNRGV